MTAAAYLPAIASGARTVLMPRLSRSERAALEAELRRESARIMRTLPPGASSDELSDHQRALKRMKDGTYGVCAGCSQHIPYERLEVMPATRWCVRCAR